ncbi:hypothetical protein AVEN_120737-1, partial [Araneus ventricosus]
CVLQFGCAQLRTAATFLTGSTVLCNIHIDNSTHLTAPISCFALDLLRLCKHALGVRSDALHFNSAHSSYLSYWIDCFNIHIDNSFLTAPISCLRMLDLLDFVNVLWSVRSDLSTSAPHSYLFLLDRLFYAIYTATTSPPGSPYP